MKINMRPNNKQNIGIRQLLLLVGLLLFLPIAQAQHLSTHDFTVSDIQCQICHSKVDIDGDIPDPKIKISIEFDTDKAISPDHLSASNRFYSHTAIRAPPAQV